MAINKNKINDNALKFIQKGQIKKAIREYEKILAEEPGDVRTLLKKGDLLVRVGNRAEAVETYLIVANAYSQQGFHLKAVAVFKQILKLDDGRIDVNLRLAEEYQNLGIVGDAMSHLQLVAAYYDQQGMARESLDILRRIVDLDPENIASRIKLAELYSREEMRDEAVDEFRKAAQDLKNANRVEDYIKVAERLIYHDPSDVQLIKELANIYLQRGDTKRALGKLQICFKSDSRDIETLSLLSMAFQELGQLSKTVSVLKEMAKIYEEQDSSSEMQDVYRRIIDIAPDDEDARRVLGAASAPSMDELSMDLDADILDMAPEPVLQEDETALETNLMPEVADQMTVEAMRPTQDVVNDVFEQPEINETSEAFEPVAMPSSNLPEEVLDHISRLLTETEVYIKYGLNTKAYEHLNKVFEVDPNNIESHTKLKDLYLSAGQQNHACQELATLVHLCSRIERQDLAQGFLDELMVLDSGYPDAAMLQDMIDQGPADTFKGEGIGESLDVDVEMEPSVDVPIDMDPDSFDQFTAPAYDPSVDSPEPSQLDSDVPFDNSADDFSPELLSVESMESGVPEFLDDPLSAIDSGLEEPDGAEVTTHVVQDDEVSDLSFYETDDEPSDPSMDDYGMDEETIDVGRMVTGQYDLDAQPEEILAIPGRGSNEIDLDPDVEGEPVRQVGQPVNDVVDADDLIIVDEEPSVVSSDLAEQAPDVQVGLDESNDVILLDDGPEEWNISSNQKLDSQTENFTTPDLASAEDVSEVESDDLNNDSPRQIIGDQPLPPAAQGSKASEPFADESEDDDEQATQLHMSSLEQLSNLDSTGSSVVADSSPAEQLDLDDSDFDDGIEEVEFFIQQNLLNEASDALEILQESYSDRQQVIELAEKLNSLRQGGVPVSQVSPEDLGEEFDLAAEIEREVGDEFSSGAVDDEFQYSVDDVFSEFKKGVERVVEKEDSATHFDLGIAYREMDLMKDAIGEFQVAAQDEKRHAEALTMIGMCYLDKEQYSEAINAFKDALHSPVITDQQATGVYYEMGNAYELLKDKNEALFYFKKVYKRDAKFRNITSRLKKIIKAAGGKSGKLGKKASAEADRTTKKPSGKNKISYM